VAAASLAEDVQQPPEDRQYSLKGTLTGGLDYATAYVHRGYVHQDGGFILQPFATAACVWATPCEVTVTPYFTAFNSLQLNGRDSVAAAGGAPDAGEGACSILHHHGGASAGSVVQPTLTGTGADWYQAEFMAGVVTYYRGLFLDLSYNLYAYPTGFFLPVQEVGAKLSYECAALWREPGADTFFGLKPYAGLYHETTNRYDREATYFETGVEPSFRFPLWGRQAGVSLPLSAGMSPNDYYVSPHGGNEFFGYWSVGAALSVPLPLPGKCGCWYLTGSVRYYCLQAEILREIAGHSDEWVGKVGLGFAF
jgi:hypothetical protein